MKNGLDYQNTLLHFLRGEKELIRELNFFYAKNPKEFINYIFTQKLENVFLEKIKEYKLEKNNILFFSTLESRLLKTETENQLKVKIGLEFLAFFKKNKIKILPYKGFVYSSLAYGNPYARKMADLDFLLENPQDAYKIFALVKENKTFMIAHGEIATENAFYWLLKSGPQEFPIVYKDVYFELHYRIRDMFYFFPRANYPWWNDFGTEKIQIEKQELEIPKKEIFFLTALCHAAHHEWIPLNLAFDLAYLLKNNALDWNLINTEAKKLGIQNLLNEGLLYTSRITGIVPYPDFPKIKQKPFILERVNFKEKRNLYESLFPGTKMPLKKFLPRFFLALKEEVTFWDRALTVLDYLFVPTDRDYAILKLPSWLYFLYYPFNPIFMLIGRAKNPAKH